MFDELKSTTLDRRSLLRSAGGFALSAGALGLLVGCGGGSEGAGGGMASILGGNETRADVSDSAVLNFALNLEYLEGEFYSRAVLGTSLTDGNLAGDNPGTVNAPNTTVNFTDNLIGDLAQELVFNERNHVADVRGVLGNGAISRPNLDYTGAFTALGAVIGKPDFDPFSNQLDFLLAAFLFEEVGVTAYIGGAGLLSSSGNILTAARLLGVEAYHGGAIRTLIADQGGTAVSLAAKISDARDTSDGVSQDKDQPVVVSGVTNYAPTDENGLAFSRTSSEVIRIATLAQPGETDRVGGFFPQGLNGTIK